MKNRNLKILTLAMTAGVVLLLPAIGFCSVDTTLDAIQGKLTSRILPAVGTLGLMWSALSFFLGSQNARSHLLLGICGAAVGFGASSIIGLIQSLVH